MMDAASFWYVFHQVHRALVRLARLLVKHLARDEGVGELRRVAHLTVLSHHCVRLVQHVSVCCQCTVISPAALHVGKSPRELFGHVDNMRSVFGAEDNSAFARKLIEGLFKVRLEPRRVRVMVDRLGHFLYSVAPQK